MMILSDYKALVKAVRKSLGSYLSREASEQLIDECYTDLENIEIVPGKPPRVYSQGDVDNLAESVRTNLQIEKRRPVEPQRIKNFPDSKPTAADRLKLEQQARLLDPYIRRLRQKYYGDPGPIDNKKVQIVEIADEFEVTISADKDAVIHALGDRWVEGLLSADNLKGLHLPSKAIKEIVAPLTLRNELQRSLENLAKATGWEPMAMRYYFNTGNIKALNRYDLYITEPPIPGPPLLTLNIRTKDLTRNELDTIYRHMRQYLGLTKKQTIAEKDVDLVTYVQKQRTSSNWETLRVAWNKRYPNIPFRSGDSMRKRYKRAVDKLNK